MRGLVLGIAGLLWCGVAFAGDEDIRQHVEKVTGGGYTFKLEYYVRPTDAEYGEDCWGHAWLFVENAKGKIVENRIICGAAYGKPHIFVKDGKISLFIIREGGTSAGWSLYRYKPQTKRLDFADLNMAEIHSVVQRGPDVLIDASTAGRREEARLIWRWGADTPEVVKTR